VLKDLFAGWLEELNTQGFCYDTLIAIYDKCEAHLIKSFNSLGAEEAITVSTISSFAHAIAMRIDRSNESTAVHNYLESKIGPPLRHLMASSLSVDALLEALRAFISSYYQTKDWFLKTSKIPSEIPNSRN
jgi:hypothetical protein